MCFASLTAVNIALPQMQKDLNIKSGNLQWLVSAYTLAFGGFLLLAGLVSCHFCYVTIVLNPLLSLQGGGRSIRQEDDVLHRHGMAYNLVPRRLLCPE
jgi:MFS family permease